MEGEDRDPAGASAREECERQSGGRAFQTGAHIYQTLPFLPRTVVNTL